MHASMSDLPDGHQDSFNSPWKTTVPDSVKTSTLPSMPTSDWNSWAPSSPMTCSEILPTATEIPTERPASGEAASPSSSPNILTSNELTPSLLAGKRVVICEDEGVTQIQLTRLLKRAGLIVVATANNGLSGVEAVLREKPDIVLMDIRMPIMDGLEATRRILKAYSVCIVVLTAFADAETREQARDAGSRGFLLKPVTGLTLVTALEQFYGESRPEPELP